MWVLVRPLLRRLVVSLQECKGGLEIKGPSKTLVIMDPAAARLASLPSTGLPTLLGRLSSGFKLCSSARTLLRFDSGGGPSSSPQ